MGKASQLRINLLERALGRLDRMARRWSSGDVPGDVDLIGWQGSLLCFVEVKTRTAHDMTR